MKYLSIVIPCYNSQNHMKKAIESCLLMKEDIEIIIVDDGSTDQTSQIGQDYARVYPEAIRFVSQENGGYGEAINTGLEHSTGLYFKVLDSDDWLDQSSLVKVIEIIKDCHEKLETIDLFLTNFVLEKDLAKKREVISMKQYFPQGRLFRWYDVKKTPAHVHLSISSMIYRTQLLRNVGMRLPKHNRYVGHMFAYVPLPCITTMYYMNVDLYHYDISGDEHCLKEKCLLKKLDEQLTMTHVIINSYEVQSVKSRKLRHYMTKYLGMMVCVTTLMLNKEGSALSKQKKEKLWSDLEKKQPQLYKSLSSTMFGIFMKKTTFIEQHLQKGVYSLTKRMFGIR